MSSQKVRLIGSMSQSQLKSNSKCSMRSLRMELNTHRSSEREFATVACESRTEPSSSSSSSSRPPSSSSAVRSLAWSSRHQRNNRKIGENNTKRCETERDAAFFKEAWMKWTAESCLGSCVFSACLPFGYRIK